MPNDTASVTPDVARRAEALLCEHQTLQHRRTDRLFAGLMVLQWVAGMAAAHWITPRTWAGTQSWMHPHVLDALFLGGIVTLLPVALALWQPGRDLTRHVIAIGQLVMSGLLIHFTGGRIETHFHVFGSLAFLAFYRDWRVLITASVVTAADHYLGGVYWPQSMYGTVSVEPWRWMEHAGWVVFEDTFLIISCVLSTREMRAIATRRARQEAAEAALEHARGRLEEHVQERTEALARVSSQHQTLLDAAGEGIYGVDAAGFTTFVNPTAAQTLGYLPEELYGQPMHACMHHTHLDGSPYPLEECPIYASLHDGVVHRVQDDVFWRQDGTSFFTDYVSTPIWEEGQVAGAVIVFRDITERKQIEAALRASEQRYRGLIDDSPEGVAVYCEGRLVYVNRAVQALLGAAGPEDILGRSIFDIVHPDFHALAHERARRVQEEQRSSSLTPQKYVRLDGAVVDVESVSTAILWEGKPAGQVLIRDITERKQNEERIAQLNAQLKLRLNHITELNTELSQAYDATIAGWSRALDLRDHETEGHSLRVTDLTMQMAEVFGITGAALVHIRRGALLHDIGKMGVPDAILLKPGPLTDDERAIMCLHPAHAYEMLSGIPFVHPALDIPYCHHEKWDGTGYPRGLQGKDIPLSARLFAVVDVWDALRSDRPYRRAWTTARTCEHIASLAGTHFDPQVVDVFLRQIVPAHGSLALNDAQLSRAA